MSGQSLHEAIVSLGLTRYNVTGPKRFNGLGFLVPRAGEVRLPNLLWHTFLWHESSFLHRVSRFQLSIASLGRV